MAKRIFPLSTLRLPLHLSCCSTSTILNRSSRRLTPQRTTRPTCGRPSFRGAEEVEEGATRLTGVTGATGGGDAADGFDAPMGPAVDAAFLAASADSPRKNISRLFCSWNSPEQGGHSQVHGKSPTETHLSKRNNSLHCSTFRLSSIQFSYGFITILSS